MSVAAAKSSVTLFTPWTKEYGRLPQASVGAEPIPQDNNPKLLGVVLDPMWTFSAHASYTAKKASSRLSVLRALADSSFGHDKECLTLTFKSIIRPFFDYAAPIVYPNYSDTSIERLQLVQNKCLRLITGCHKAASIDHLHSESLVLPVKSHLHLLSSQYLARALNPSNPSHPHVAYPPPPGHRKLKETLRSKCWDSVAPFLQNDVLPAGKYKETLKALHIQSISDTVDGFSPNRVLGSAPPLIHPSESSLPRLTRVTLSQLRSGHCARLNDFLFRIGRANDDLCPDCRIAPHTSSHIFNCQSHPTTLSTEDLWERPREAAIFLASTPSFSFLPDPGSPPPPPPRRRQRGRPPPEPPPP